MSQVKPAATFPWGAYQQAQAVPKSEGQRRYHRQLSYADIIVALGPAGTGKTLFAVQVQGGYISTESQLYLGCVSCPTRQTHTSHCTSAGETTARLYLGCISAVSRLYLPYISTVCGAGGSPAAAQRQCGPGPLLCCERRLFTPAAVSDMSRTCPLGHPRPPGPHWPR